VIASVGIAVADPLMLIDGSQEGQQPQLIEYWTNASGGSALADLREKVPEAAIVHSRICGSEVEINHRRQRVAAQFVPRMFRSGSWFDLTWFWRNDGRRAVHR
jgi:hypothetical protein